MSRRGACPTLAAPMMTGDGLLVRLALERPGLSPAVLLAIAAAAADHGNGLIDVSARGNIQIRGISGDSLAALTRRLEALEILALDGPAIAVNPLAGIDPAIRNDPLSLARIVRELASELRLAPKVAIVIDGRGALPLDGLVADIRMVASDGGWSIALGGDALSAVPLAWVDEGHAGAAALAILELLASRGDEGRARSILACEGLAPFTNALTPLPARSSRAKSRDVAQRVSTEFIPSDAAGGVEGLDTNGGIGRQSFGRDAQAVGIGLPFGQIDAAALGQLARTAARLGATSICPATGRTLIVTGLTPARADRLADAARKLGLIVDPADPRLSIAACSGRPACASAHFDTRAIAGHIAEHAPSLASRGIHISGCPKGCAHPGPATVTLVGRPEGIGLVAAGRADAPPSLHLPHLDPAALAARITDYLESKP